MIFLITSFIGNNYIPVTFQSVEFQSQITNLKPFSIWTLYIRAMHGAIDEDVKKWSIAVAFLQP